MFWPTYFQLDPACLVNEQDRMDFLPHCSNQSSMDYITTTTNTDAHICHKNIMLNNENLYIHQQQYLAFILTVDIFYVKGI